MATITWRNLNAPQLQTNFQDNSLKGFNDLFSGLAQQNQYAKDKEKADTTEALKSSLFNYTGTEGSQALGTLLSSGQFGQMMSTLGDKVDQGAIRDALLSTQTRLGQENQRAQVQTERDRLLAQKPYVDAVDLLVSKGDLPGAKAYATGLSQQGVLDNDFASKVFGAIGSAETAAQDRTSKLGFDKLRMDNALLEQSQLKQKQLEAQQVDQFTRSILTGAAPEAPQQLQQPQATDPTQQTSAAGLVDSALAVGSKKGVVPAALPNQPPVPAKNTESVVFGSGGKPVKSTEPIVIPPDVTFTPPRVAVQSKVPITKNATTVQATILSVVDGDTLDVKTIKGDEFRCRVDLIQTPETDKKWAGKVGDKGGDAATEKLMELTREGKATVTVMNGRQKDNHGRFICQIEVSGNDVGLEMVKQGAARLFKEYGANPEEYKNANTQAKQQGLGVYAPSPQEVQQDAVKARLQATLSNPATPKPIYDAAVKLAEQLEKTKLETNQQAINMRANALSIAEDQKKSVLGVAGLSGSTLGKNFDDVLKTLSSVGIKQDADDPFLGSSKYDQFENIARVLTSDARFNEVDTGVVDKIIKKSFVEGGKNYLFDSDDDFSKIIKKELLSYVNSRKFYEDREFIKNTSSQTAKLTQELREARERDLRIKPK